MKKNKIKHIFSIICIVILVIAVLSIIVQKLSGSLPTILGHHIMYVVTGSMEPEIHVNDAILVKNVDGKNVKEGDVVCYYSENDDTKGMIISHQVIKAPYEENGQWYIQTKGIANMEADEPVKVENVVGVMVYKFFTLGFMYRFFKTVPGLIVILMLIGWCIFSEVREINKTIKEEKKNEEVEI